MQVRPRNVEVYESASGATPFDDWMRNLKDPIGKAIYIADDGRASLILFAGRKNTQKQDIKTAKKQSADYKVRS